MDKYSCYMPQCPRRESCTLWHIAQQEIAEEYVFLSVTNPQLIEQAGGYSQCPKYYEWKLRRFARGMRWRYGTLTGNAEAEIHERLKDAFGFTQIGRMRRGDVVISPEEQAQIREIFEEVAPGAEPEFIAFEEHYIKPPRRK